MVCVVCVCLDCSVCIVVVVRLCCLRVVWCLFHFVSVRVQSVRFV